MMIKILLISGIIGVVIFAVRGGSAGVSLAARRICGVIFTAVAAISILFPQIVTWLANQVNVKRGTDLVLYVLVVVFLYVTIGLHQKIHRLETRLTELTRAVALLTYEHSERDAGAASAPARSES